MYGKGREVVKEVQKSSTNCSNTYRVDQPSTNVPTLRELPANSNPWSRHVAAETVETVKSIITQNGNLSKIYSISAKLNEKTLIT